jgi:hypothetical protein
MRGKTMRASDGEGKAEHGLAAFPGVAATILARGLARAKGFKFPTR